MSNLVIKDLHVETVLDRKTMASVTGGFFMLGLYQLVANAAAAATVENDDKIDDTINVSWMDNKGETGGAKTAVK